MNSAALSIPSLVILLIIGIALGVLFVRGIFAMRTITQAPPSSSVCPHCGYDIRGLDTTLCPECGNTLNASPSHAAVRRSRRQLPGYVLANGVLAWTVFSLITLIAAVLFTTAKYSDFTVIGSLVFWLVGIVWIFVMHRRWERTFWRDREKVIAERLAKTPSDSQTARARPSSDH